MSAWLATKVDCFLYACIGRVDDVTSLGFCLHLSFWLCGLRFSFGLTSLDFSMSCRFNQKTVPNNNNIIPSKLNPMLEPSHVHTTLMVLRCVQTIISIWSFNIFPPLDILVGKALAFGSAFPLRLARCWHSEQNQSSLGTCKGQRLAVNPNHPRGFHYKENKLHG